MQVQENENAPSNMISYPYIMQQNINSMLPFFPDFTLENMSARFSRLIAEYSSFQAKCKQRLAKLETD